MEEEDSLFKSLNTSIDTGISASLTKNIDSIDASMPQLNFGKPSLWGGFKGFMGDGWLSTKDDKTGITTEGKLGASIGAFAGIANTYLGWQQYNLAKDQMNQNKKIFNLNFGAQAQSLNTQMEDRQRARVAMQGAKASGGSVEDYMKKNAISAKGI
jgi:hypothetical protein